MNIEMWTEDCNWIAIHRMAHLAFPFGRYIVILYGYSHSDEEPPKTYEFDQSSIVLYDILENKHHICKAVVEESTCIEHGIEPSVLASSGSSSTWHDSLVFMFAGFSIHHKRSTNYLSYIDFKSKPLVVKIISGGTGTQIKPVPSCRDKCSLNYWENQLFVFGGYGFRPSEVVDSDTNASPYYLEGNGAFVVNYNDGDERSWNNQLLVYDLNTNTWSSPKNFGQIPTPRAAHATCVVENKLYLFGGRSHSLFGVERLNDLYSLSLPDLEWTQITLNGDIPCGRSWITLNSLSADCLLLVGGLDAQNQPLSDAFSITLNGDRLCTVLRAYPNPSASPGKPRLWHTSTTGFDGCVYSIGGCSTNLFSEEAKIQTQIDRYHVMRPISLFKQSLRAVAKYRFRDTLLPATLLSELDALDGG